MRRCASGSPSTCSARSTADEDLDGPPSPARLRRRAGARWTALGEGLASFARAAHDRAPPPELHDRVMTALRARSGATLDDGLQPRRATSHVAGSWPRPSWRSLVVASRWGLARADAPGDVGAEDARELRPCCSRRSAARSSGWARSTPTGAHRRGQRRACTTRTRISRGCSCSSARRGRLGHRDGPTLHAPDGRTRRRLARSSSSRDGDGDGWLVTSEDLQPFDRLTIAGRRRDAARRRADRAAVSAVSAA